MVTILHSAFCCSLAQSFNNTGLFEEVAKHQHTEQRCDIRQNERAEDGDEDREYDFLLLTDRAQLLHSDLALLLRGQQLHDRWLDERDKRHVGVCCDCDRGDQIRCEVIGTIYRGRAVCTTNDANRRRLLRREEASSICDHKRNIDAKLRCRTENQADWVCDQRTEIGHCADAHKDQAGEKAALYTAVHDSDDAGLVPCTAVNGRIVHKAGLRQVCQKHTESYGQQQKRLKFLFNGKVEQNTGNDEHDNLTPCQRSKS